MTFTISLKLCFILAIEVSTIAAECNISINKDLTDPQPLLLNDGSYPSPSYGSDEILFDNDEFFEVYCPGTFVTVRDKSTKSNSTLAKCNNGKFIISDVDNEVYGARGVPFSDVTCSKQSKSSARFTGNTCLNKFKEFEIGFRHKLKFLTLITGCFDNFTQTSIYTRSEVPKTIAGYQASYPRPSNWLESLFSLKNVNDLYKRGNQRSTINELLGLGDSSTKYISNNNDYYLSRGHLSPKTDFLFGSQQRATFYFANAVPQWQILNRGNWLALENDIRALANDRELDLVVYTGTYKILTLPHHSTGKQIKLYLYKRNSIKKLPIPQYVWKVVYHQKSKAGVAFIGLNNPYVKKLEKYTICENICDKLGYITWSPSDTKYGYVYCCAVNDLRENMDVIPEIDIEALLL